ncbi:MAG TPA: hypothetical protein VFA04_11975 [Bryobacteraceae bacterium]|nr:hypothetical protein [Bryobacteraceae bacterium]
MLVGMPRGINIIALVLSLVWPLVTPALAASTPPMACCRTRGSCCCRSNAAGRGPAFAASCRVCVSARSTAPSLRYPAAPPATRSIAAVAGAHDPIAWSTAFIRSVRTRPQFQRPPPSA